MATVREIADFLEELAPSSLKMDFDNVGLLVGLENRPVERVLVALDITEDVIDEAENVDAELIVSHHPLFFAGLKSVTDGDATGEKIVRLLTGGISAVCMHTNLDAAPGGVNDALAAALGLSVRGILNRAEGISRICALPEAMDFESFLSRVCAALSANGLRYHDAGRPVSVVGICGGAGGDDLTLAAESGCDTYVTADLKYHQFLLAKELGLNLIDAGHFCTENVIVPVLHDRLTEKFPELLVIISRRHVQTDRFYIPD
ncbi:MAG: Nif3-like dinuclear metal center hexameric protein [Oscillospiraceae bacterium]